ncbi:hypothetical protein NQ176_g1621 [Zarea fungicola]|uniref:Uncharacterized protein n=1 Tax=Zarea fungicola TaxID=93591 RepID=A0ACC1NT51_9HYPO|nr:hypothetical protein NQ176_g1621 [Lecanicillium fungicola]
MSDMIIELTAPNGLTYHQPIGLFINNEFVRSSSGQKIPTTDPTHETEITQVFAADADDVDLAVNAARAAFRDPSWRGLSSTDRGKLLSRLGSLIEENARILATIETWDNGKPYEHALTVAIPIVANTLKYYGGWADKIHGDVIETTRSKLNYTILEPIGVCGQIIPWNFPLAMAAWKLGPALACGNTVVLKAAEQTPLSALFLASLVKKAGFPPGTVNILNGLGRTAGAAIASHPGIDKIAFTGSTETGRQIMKLAATNLKNITLETGGKSPLLVFDDAEFDAAISWAHTGVMFNQGQVCTATSRILVQEGVYDRFVEAFKAQVAKVSKIGDPFSPSTFQGPQVSKAQYERILEDDMKIFREEVFGPFVVISSFKTEDEAVTRANDSCYGLGSAIFTRDIKRAHRVARNIEAGMVWINSSNDSDFRVPFGGVKQSGIGRELGQAGLSGYCNVKSVHVNLD